MNELNKNETNKIFKQRLQRVHVITGISFSLLMYLAVFFGVFAIMLPYIDTWEKPSRHIQTADITKIDYSAMIDPVLKDPDYPTINGVSVSLPGYMNDPALSIYAQFTKERLFDPNTNMELENEGDQSQLAWFLNSMHYGRPLNDFGYYIFGFMAVAGMFLVIGGVIQVLVIKYKNSGKNSQSRFSKWHRKIFTWLFLPFIIITLTGALMNIGYLISTPMTLLASKGEHTQAWKLSDPVLYPPVPRIEKKNDKVPMLKMNELIKKAQEINSQINFQEIEITNWNDSSATVKFIGYNPYKLFLNGISNNPSVTLSAVDGKLITQQKVMDKHWSGLFYDSIFFLHFLFGVDVFTRFFIAFIMTISAFALGFGVLLYLEKKAKRFPKNVPVYQGMGKLCLATMIGVIPATGLLFVLQWTLPFDLQDRFLIQKGLFSVAWVATFTWSFYRINSYQAASEFLKIGGVLFLISPFIHFYSSGFSPLNLINQNMTNILGVDIALFIVGLLFSFVGYKLPQKREEIEKFWTKIL